MPVGMAINTGLRLCGIQAEIKGESSPQVQGEALQKSYYSLRTERLSQPPPGPQEFKNGCLSCVNHVREKMLQAFEDGKHDEQHHHDYKYSLKCERLADKISAPLCIINSVTPAKRAKTTAKCK